MIFKIEGNRLKISSNILWNQIATQPKPQITLINDL